MSFDNLLNLEILDIKIIKEEISKMTDDNVIVGEEGCDNELNTISFTNNLHHGVIAITFIENLVETSINTMISKCLYCMDDDILRASSNVKLHLLCAENHVDFNDIVSDNVYSIYKEAKKIRNDITHYKTNILSCGAFITPDVMLPKGTSKKAISQIFTKKEMTYYFENAIKLIELICDKCGYYVCEDCEIIDCDGRGYGYEFISTTSEEDF